mmetsp:Transcript_8413/g.35178  ORF Transcript_8413/g.35178 Transcript_8413/m.35178 type:complete len:232 (-) Transcript_8413:552-1247(-)
MGSAAPRGPGRPPGRRPGGGAGAGAARPGPARASCRALHSVTFRIRVGGVVSPEKVAKAVAQGKEVLEAAAHMREAAGAQAMLEAAFYWADVATVMLQPPGAVLHGLVAHLQPLCEGECALMLKLCRFRWRTFLPSHQQVGIRAEELLVDVREGTPAVLAARILYTVSQEQLLNQATDEQRKALEESLRTVPACGAGDAEETEGLIGCTRACLWEAQEPPAAASGARLMLP